MTLIPVGCFNSFGSKDIEHDLTSCISLCLRQKFIYAGVKVTILQAMSHDQSPYFFLFNNNNNNINNNNNNTNIDNDDDDRRN